MSELTAQDIHNLFDSEKMESDTPRKVFLALFADTDDDYVLMFLGKIYNSLNDPDNQLDWGLDFLLMEAFKRTNAHGEAQAAYIKQLLHPKPKRGKQ